MSAALVADLVVDSRLYAGLCPLDDPRLFRDSGEGHREAT